MFLVIYWLLVCYNGLGYYKNYYFKLQSKKNVFGGLVFFGAILGLIFLNIASSINRVLHKFHYISKLKTNNFDMKTLLRSFCMVSLFFWFSGLEGQTIKSFNNPCSITECFTKRFEASGIPAMFNNHVGSYRFFWYMGDGTYYDYEQIISSNADISFVNHSYEVTGNYEVYMEVVPRYEIDKPPKRFNFPNDNATPVPVTVNCTILQCSTPLSSPPSSPFFVKTNRDMVKGNMFSYLLTYAHTCKEFNIPLSGTISMKFPDDKLEVDIPSFQYGIPNTNVSISSPDAAGDITVNWIFTNLGVGKTRHIIVPMKVKDVLSTNIGDEIDVAFDVTFSDCIPPISTSFPMEVRNSHDPNNLDSDKAFSCEVLDANTVKYTIRFKNDGDAPADTVLIKNVIPDVFNLNTIHTEYPQNSATLHEVISGTQEVRWELTGGLLRGNKDLHGTKELGYGQLIHEEDCIDSIVFRIDKHPASVINKCNAIINRAEIIFDCNPSFYTEPYIFRFGCTDTLAFVDTVSIADFGLLDSNLIIAIIDTIITPVSSSSPDTLLILEIINTANCINCTEVSIIELAAIAYTGQPVQLNVSTAQLPDLNGIEYMWYPSTGLDDPRLREPMASPIKSTDYYLVASNPNSCQRAIFQKQVNIPCNLDIITSIQCNSSNNTKSITASVVSSSPHLRWQDCKTFGDTFTLSNLSNEYLYLSVVDTLTNCSAVLNVKMVCKNSPPPPSPWGAIAGFIGLAIALGFVLYYSGWL